MPSTKTAPHWLYSDGVGAGSIVHKAADQSSVDAVALADVTGMSWEIVANGVYTVEFVIFQVAAATTTGLVLALNGPANPTYLRYAVHADTSATAEFQGGATAYDTAIVSTGVTSATVPSMARMWGYVANGATAGTLILRMRTEVGASAATVQRGSWGRLTRVA